MRNQVVLSFCLQLALAGACIPVAGQDLLSDAYEKKGNELYEKGQYTDAFKYLKQTLTERLKNASPDNLLISEVYVKLGNCALKMNDLPTAISMFSGAIKLQSESPVAAQALLGLAKCYTEKNKFSDAEAKLRQVLAMSEVRSIERENIAAMQLLGSLYLKQNRKDEGEVLLKQACGKLAERLDDESEKYAEQVIESCNSVLAISPTDAQTLTVRALCQKRLGKTEFALNDLEAALKSDCKYYEAYLAKASLEADLRNLVDAMNDFDKAESLKPSDYRFYRAKAEAYSKNGKLDLAIPLMAKAISCKPADSKLLTTKAKYELFTDSFGSCIDDCSRAIMLDSRNANAYAIRAVANYLFLPGTEKYTQDLAVAESLDSQNSFLTMFKGLREIKQRRLDDAVSSLTAALKVEPYDPYAHMQRGFAFYALNNTYEALKDLDAAIAINPKHYSLFALRGSIKTDLDDLSGAMEDFNSAVSFRPADEGVYLARAKCLRKLGKIDLAKVDLEAAARINPRNPAALILLDTLNGDSAGKNSTDKLTAVEDAQGALKVVNSKTWWTKTSLGWSPTIGMIVENASQKNLSGTWIQFQGQFLEGSGRVQIARQEFSEGLQPRQRKTVWLRSPYVHSLDLEHEKPPALDFRVMAKISNKPNVDPILILTGTVAQSVIEDSVAVAELTKRNSSVNTKPVVPRKK